MTKICRIITDDKVGNFNPALALAEAIMCDIPFEIQHIRVKNIFFLRLIPSFIIKIFSHYFWLNKIFKIPFNSDVTMTIGNGSASIVPCLVLSCLERKHQGHGLFVQLQNPRINCDYFDYVVAPDHDNLWGNNVIPIIGSLSRVKKLLETQSFSAPSEFSFLEKPLIAVFIGGKNSRYEFSTEETKELAYYLLNFATHNKVSLVITCSRRTVTKNEMILRSILTGNHIYFPETSEIPANNPYYAMLQHCEASIVTSDSVNMVSDSITAGLPTYLYELKGDKGKFNDFYTILKQKRLLFSTTDTYQKIKIDEFNETGRVARIMIAALLKKKEYYV